MPKAKTTPPIAVIFGDEEFQKANALHRLVDSLLPPSVDRAMALCEYDGSRSEDQGGPSLASVMDDLATMPFLADRRVVVIRDADKFISAHRDRLENYLKSPAMTSTLILVCRSFPKNTRVSKAAVAAGGLLTECKKLSGRGLVDFVIAEARTRGKRIDYVVAARLADLVGQDAGVLTSEVEKLCLYAADRPAIAADDVADLVGITREEKIFAVMDAAAAGNVQHALRLWSQVIVTDPAASFKAVGGMAHVIRRWIQAHRMVAEGLSIREIAPKAMMWGRERELDTILRRLSPARLKRILAAIADLDSQAKVGSRSIDTGVEALLCEMAAPAA